MTPKLLTCIEAAIILILMTVFFIIGPRYFTHIMSKETQMILCTILGFITVIIFGGIQSYIEVIKKPVLTTEVKVISKEYRANGQGNVYSSYYAFFLTNNGTKLELAISKKQYKAINENDSVELVYQGVIAYSIKNLADGTVIINKGYAPKDIKFK